MAFLLAALEKDRGASYGDLKAAAEKKDLKVFPIMYGRAQALLGIVKAAKRGEGKAAKATKAAKAAKAAKVVKAVKASAAPARTAGKRGRPMNSDSKSGQIRALIQTGMSAADIAAKVGCTTALVYNVKSAVAGGKRRGPGRPAKAAAPALSIGGGLDGIAGIVAAVKQSEQQRASLHAVLVRIQAILADALS